MRRVVDTIPDDGSRPGVSWPFRAWSSRESVLHQGVADIAVCTRCTLDASGC